MKNKKGFTLIELLAVIIILGVLMIIAIPSVTKYINDSRKSGYVSTAKNIVGGARNLVYSGQLDISDKDVTYYIDGECIKTDNGYKSPYGNITKSYVAVVLDGDNYEYYWMSVDDTNTGVNAIKNIDELENEDIVGDIDSSTIEPNIGIDKRKKIIKIEGENCVKSAPQDAARKMNSKTGKIGDPCPSVTDTIYWAINNNKLILSDSEVSGTSSGSFPGDSEFSYSNPSPWTNEDSKNVTEIEVIGTVVPGSLSDWFSNVGFSAESFNADLRNLEVCNVSNMSYAFSSVGMKSPSFSLNISGWDTSSVTDMSGMFNYAGSMSSTWNVIGLNSLDTSSVTNMSIMFGSIWYNIANVSLDLSNWDTSSVTTMSEMFRYSAEHSSSVNLNLNNWDTSKVSNMSNMFESFGEDATSWIIGGLIDFNTSSLTSTYCMFRSAAQNATTLNIDLSSWNTSHLESIERMFQEFGTNSTSVSINLNNWDTSNVTNMGWTFVGVGGSATTLNINISSFNTSKVANMYSMFENTGYNATNYSVIIPRTNGNGINNTTTKIYGETSDVVAESWGKQFTLAS